MPFPVSEQPRLFGSEVDKRSGFPVLQSEVIRLINILSGWITEFLISRVPNIIDTSNFFPEKPILT